jgi:hypothetical protein
MLSGQYYCAIYLFSYIYYFHSLDINIIRLILLCDLSNIYIYYFHSLDIIIRLILLCYLSIQLHLLLSFLRY